MSSEVTSLYIVDEVAFMHLVKAKFVSIYAMGKDGKTKNGKGISRQMIVRFKTGKNVKPNSIDTIAEILGVKSSVLYALRTLNPEHPKNKQTDNDTTRSSPVLTLAQNANKYYSKKIDIHQLEPILLIPLRQGCKPIPLYDKFTLYPDSLILEDLLADQQSFMLIGGSGSGKTTLLHFIGAMITTLTPIYIDLQGIGDRYSSFKKRVIATIIEVSGIEIDQIDKVNFSFLFDDYDQVSSDIQAHVREFMDERKIAGCKDCLVLTCSMNEGVGEAYFDHFLRLAICYNLRENDDVNSYLRRLECGFLSRGRHP